jgi:hypothetical protein
MNDYDKKYFDRFAMDTNADLDWDDQYDVDVDFNDDDELVPFDSDTFPVGDDELLDDDIDFEN